MLAGAKSASDEHDDSYAGQPGEQTRKPTNKEEHSNIPYYKNGSVSQTNEGENSMAMATITNAQSDKNVETTTFTSSTSTSTECDNSSVGRRKRIRSTEKFNKHASSESQRCVPTNDIRKDMPFKRTRQSDKIVGLTPLASLRLNDASSASQRQIPPLTDKTNAQTANTVSKYECILIESDDEPTPSVSEKGLEKAPSTKMDTSPSPIQQSINNCRTNTTGTNMEKNSRTASFSGEMAISSADSKSTSEGNLVQMQSLPNLKTPTVPILEVTYLKWCICFVFF